jgi:hypothetical protein
MLDANKHNSKKKTDDHHSLKKNKGDTVDTNMKYMQTNKETDS